MSVTLNCQSADIRVSVVTPAPITATLQIGQGPAGATGAQGPAGPAGPQGPPGPGGGSDAHYRHDQVTASTTWTVVHNLGKRPAVQVFDSAGDEAEGLLRHVTLDECVIEFSAPFSGTVICN